MKTKVSKQTKDAIQGAITEIIAGSVLFPRSEEDRIWNRANERSKSILEKYLRGEGLFQIPTKKSKLDKDISNL